MISPRVGVVCRSSSCRRSRSGEVTTFSTERASKTCEFMRQKITSVPNKIPSVPWYDVILATCGNTATMCCIKVECRMFICLRKPEVDENMIKPINNAWQVDKSPCTHVQTHVWQPSATAPQLKHQYWSLYRSSRCSIGISSRVAPRRNQTKAALRGWVLMLLDCPSLLMQVKWIMHWWCRVYPFWSVLIRFAYLKR